MQNAAFAAAGLDWAYVPLPVGPERLGEAVRGLVALGFAGANVTIPHKTAVLRLLRRARRRGGRAASVNTLVDLATDGSCSSTDGLAVTEAVEAAGAPCSCSAPEAPRRPSPSALLEAGAARVRVAARRAGASRRLVGLLSSAFPCPRGRIAGLAAGTARRPTIVVNATPLKDELVLEPRPTSRSSTSPTFRTGDRPRSSPPRDRSRLPGRRRRPRRARPPGCRVVRALDRRRRSDRCRCVRPFVVPARRISLCS